MTKTKNTFLSGAIVLVMCSFITKILGAIYKIPLLKTLQSDGLGRYQMVISVYALFLVISSSGMVVTLSKIISRESNYKNRHNQKKYLISAVIIALLLSTISAVIMIIISPIIAKFRSFEELYYSFLAISPALIFSSLIAVFRGYLLGKKRMVLGGGIQVFEAVLKLLFSLYLSIKFASSSGFGPVFGAILGITICELFSLALLIVLVYIKSKKDKSRHIVSSVKSKTDLSKLSYLKLAKLSGQNGDNKSNINNLKSKSRYIGLKTGLIEIFKTSFFVTLQACVLPLISAIDSLIIVPLLIKAGINQSIAYSLFGLEDGVVSAIIAMPTIVASGISSAIIPNIKAQNNNTETIKNAIKIVWLTSIFCSAIFIFFSKDITYFLYGSGLISKTINELGISSDLLKISGFNIIYISMLTLSTGILQGLDRSKEPVKNLLIALTIRYIVLIGCLSNSQINIYGIALSNMAFYAVAMLLNLSKLKNISALDFKLDKLFLLPLLSLFVVILSMNLIKIVLSQILATKMTTLIIMFSGGLIYLLLLSFTKVFSYREVFSLKRQSAKNN